MDKISTITYENLEVKTVLDTTKNYRYSITRVWDTRKDKVTIIMYNPRTLNPNPYILGQSLSKCVEIVIKEKEIGAIEVVNLFPRISNSQKELEKAFKKFDEINILPKRGADNANKRPITPNQTTPTHL